MNAPAKKSSVMSPQQAAASMQVAPGGPRPVKLTKGELLFGEGENSKAMYFLKAGMLRIFKKKGNSFIEIATIHSGQIVGELAFLDGQPRSAAAEALTNCELVEISGTTFTQTMARIPDWLKLMLKTIVGRLRASSTRIRQLEQASTAFDYSSKDGKRSAHYIYVSPTDALKIGAAILLVGSRNGEKIDKGIKIRVGLLQRYANQIMGVPVAKITDYLDVLHQVGICHVDEATSDVSLLDPDLLEKFIAYYNEENLKEPDKRKDVSLKGYLIMSLIVKHLAKYPKDAKTNMSTVNLAQIHQDETAAAGGKEPFRMEEVPDLADVGYCSNLAIKNSKEAFTTLQPEEFVIAYKFQRVVKAIQALNEKKSGK